MGAASRRRLDKRRISKHHGYRFRDNRTLEGSTVTPLRWGQAAPDFELSSTLGRSISLKQFRDQAEVVLGFYCFDWGGI